MLSKKDLEEVIVYTKESLKSRLVDLDENLVEKIDFLCVSAKMASDFYKGLAPKESLQKVVCKNLKTIFLTSFMQEKKARLP